MNTTFQQNGLSVVELLIAVGLGTLLSMSLVQLFINNKATFRAQNAITNLQQNGRMASFILSRDLRMAGYMGCAHINVIAPNNYVASPPLNLRFSNNDIILGYESNAGAWNPVLPGLANPVRPDTDVIRIRKTSEDSSPVTVGMTSLTDPIQINNISNLQPNDIVMISDCSRADIFQITNVTSTSQLLHDNSNNISSSLSTMYQADAQVSPYQMLTYYISDTGRVNGNNQPIFALYREDQNGTATEMVEGVEDLQITYGVDTDGDNSVDVYQNAMQVAATNDWPRVVSANILLLVSSVEEAATTPQGYTFNRTAVAPPADRQVRQEWSTYVKFRNRGL